MKLGIVTFHCSYNYGSVLQAWALQTYLESLGHKVVIIDYRGEDFRQYGLITRRTALETALYVWPNLCHLSKNIRRKKSFQSFWHEQLRLSEMAFRPNSLSLLKSYSKQFDYLICGSDQIWNLNVTRGVDECYFLGFGGNGVGRIAYAPSLGSSYTKPKYLTADAEKELRQLLDRFQAISVRETSSINRLEHYTHNQVVAAVDPTLLLNANAYHNICSSECPSVDVNDYLFLYSLGLDSDCLSYANDIAKENKIEIVYINPDNYRFDVRSYNVYGCTPGNFLSYIKNAVYVLSNSFHATAFSVLFKKQFGTFGTTRESPRMGDLLESCGLSWHLMGNGPDWILPIEGNSIYSIPDYSDAEGRLAELRKDSETFLNNALTAERLT